MRERFDPDGQYEEYEVDGTREAFVQDTGDATTTESIDDRLEEDRPRSEEQRDEDAPDYPSDLGEDESTAAEQGNREGDEMVSEGDDDQEVTELDGDDEDIDALRDEDHRDPDWTQVDLGGERDGRDPLAGGR